MPSASAPAYSASERRPFTIEEQTAILHAAQEDRLYMLVVLAQATGLRQSELLGLRWSQADLDARTLTVMKQLGRDGRLKDLKTAAGKRVLPLPASVVDLLRHHQADQERERTESPYLEDHGFLLSTGTGRPVGPRNAHRSWTRILVRAGVAHRGVHHLRHAYVTMLAEQGVHERVAQQLAGHADSRVTREVYTHVTARMLDGAVEAIERASQASTRAIPSRWVPKWVPRRMASPHECWGEPWCRPLTCVFLWWARPNTMRTSPRWSTCPRSPCHQSTPRCAGTATASGNSPETSPGIVQASAMMSELPSLDGAAHDP